MKISAILVAGGSGSRMGTNIPKQFRQLEGKAVVLYSLEVLLQIPQVEEIIVVCPTQFHTLFDNYPVKFALPGLQRQDSVYSGLLHVSDTFEWVTIHDAARPFITKEMVQKLFDAGKNYGASSLAMPVKNTLKEVQPNQNVIRTLDRSKVWEIQTPQLLKKEILQAGFAYAHKHQIAVTDDVSLAELIGHPVHLVASSYQNIKITTPEDWFFAESFSKI
jgi:2-C-methyl-D-erythritol 4-phosphate cytidylyltransferase